MQWCRIFKKCSPLFIFRAKNTTLWYEKRLFFCLTKFTLRQNRLTLTPFLVKNALPLPQKPPILTVEQILVMLLGIELAFKGLTFQNV